MNNHTSSLILVYSVLGAPTFTESLAFTTVLPYAEYSPVDDPIRALFDKWTGNPILPRTLATMGHREVLHRMDRRAVMFDAGDILLDAVAAGDVEFIEWFKNEFVLYAMRQGFATKGLTAGHYCEVAARNGRVEYLACWWPQLLPENKTKGQNAVDRIFDAAGDLSVLQWLEATV
ncbi:hypothetical protein BC828DRAFT_400624 [Blastocladiella britannica]|nr:hypothetical protein BC828DRAFT_400624 [Blastocladiella britannica]